MAACCRRRKIVRNQTAQSRFACQLRIVCGGRAAKVRDREGAIVTSPRRPLSPALQQLIRIDVDSDSDVFGKGQFVERFANEAAQAHNRFATDQDVKAELAL